MLIWQRLLRLRATLCVSSFTAATIASTAVAATAVMPSFTTSCATANPAPVAATAIATTAVTATTANVVQQCMRAGIERRMSGRWPCIADSAARCGGAV